MVRDGYTELKTSLNKLAMNQFTISISIDALLKIYPILKENNTLQKKETAIHIDSYRALTRILFTYQNFFTHEKITPQLCSFIEELSTVAGKNLYYHLQNDKIQKAVLSGKINLGLLTLVNETALSKAIKTAHDFSQLQYNIIKKSSELLAFNCILYGKNAMAYENTFYQTSEYVLDELIPVLQKECYHSTNPNNFMPSPSAKNSEYLEFKDEEIKNYLGF